MSLKIEKIITESIINFVANLLVHILDIYEFSLKFQRRNVGDFSEADVYKPFSGKTFDFYVRKLAKMYIGILPEVLVQ